LRASRIFFALFAVKGFSPRSPRMFVSSGVRAALISVLAARFSLCALCGQELLSDSPRLFMQPAVKSFFNIRIPEKALDISRVII
jgi:hypothetical protein